MAEQRFRVLVVATHPVQYMAPILRRLSNHPRLQLKVAYCSLRGAEAALDPEFGATVRWDVPLLDGYDWVEVPNKGSGAESFFGLYNPGLWHLIRKGNFDAILCFVGYVRGSFWIALAAARLTNSAFLFGTDASSLAPRDSRSWKVSARKLFWPRLFRLADQVIVPSSAGVDMMHALGLPGDRVTLTPFVVDNDWWSAHAASVDRVAIRNSWGVAPNELVVLFCAKLQSWKRPLDVLHAFAAARIPDSVLVFAGEGPLRPQLEADAHRLGVASRLRFLGFTNQSQLPAVYSAADLFVLPSEYDPCPVVACEAMLCGLPVLLSDSIRGRFDLVQPGKTGGIFPCGNVDALASLLSRILSDRAALATLARNARARMDTWSPRENIAATVEAIRLAVSRRHRSSAKLAWPALRAAARTPGLPTHDFLRETAKLPGLRMNEERICRPVSSARRGVGIGSPGTAALR
ncbi:MAG TPA: glycosyltransferase family 4 protein [Candidatus Acidoferrum sp.]